MTDLRHLMESNSGTAWLMGHVTLRKLLKQFRPLSQNFKMKMILPECQFISYYEMKRYCTEKKTIWQTVSYTHNKELSY